MIVKSKGRPVQNRVKVIKEKQAEQPKPPTEAEDERDKSAVKPKKEQTAFPVVITILLLIPLLLVMSVGFFICWRKNGMYDNKAKDCCRKKERKINSQSSLKKYKLIK